MIKLICETPIEKEYHKNFMELLNKDYIPYIKIAMSEKEWEKFDVNLVELDGSHTKEDNLDADFLVTPVFQKFKEYKEFVYRVKEKLEDKGYKVEID